MKLGKPFMDMQVSRYRKTAGDTAPVMMGFPVVLLTTLGARTGREHTKRARRLCRRRRRVADRGFQGWPATHPAWFVNLAKNPDKVWLEVGKRKFQAHVESLQGTEREAALATSGQGGAPLRRVPARRPTERSR